jgi:hypothetical protein
MCFWAGLRCPTRRRKINSLRGSRKQGFWASVRGGCFRVRRGRSIRKQRQRCTISIVAGNGGSFSHDTSRVHPRSWHSTFSFFPTPHTARNFRLIPHIPKQTNVSVDGSGTGLAMNPMVKLSSRVSYTFHFKRNCLNLKSVLGHTNGGCRFEPRLRQIWCLSIGQQDIGPCEGLAITEPDAPELNRLRGC